MDETSNITSERQGRVVFVVCQSASHPVVSETIEAFSTRGHHVHLIELARQAGLRDQPNTRRGDATPELTDPVPDIVVNLLAVELMNPMACEKARPDAVLTATGMLLSLIGKHVRLVTASASWTMSNSTQVAHDPQDPLMTAARAITELEQLASTVHPGSSIVLRLAIPYGVGTPLSAKGSVGRLVARRRLPLIPRATGRASFIHSADAATAIAMAAESELEGTYVAGDHPAATHNWLPFLAHELSAPLPRSLPRALAMWRCGPVAHWLAHGSAAPTSTAFAHDTGWRPAMASWREGFASTLFDIPFADPQALISCQRNRPGYISTTDEKAHVPPD